MTQSAAKLEVGKLYRYCSGRSVWSFRHSSTEDFDFSNRLTIRPGDKRVLLYVGYEESPSHGPLLCFLLGDRKMWLEIKWEELIAYEFKRLT